MSCEAYRIVHTLNTYQICLFTSLPFLPPLPLPPQGGLNAQTYVHIEVLDLNDNPPVFNPQHYVTSLSSHAQPGTEVLQVIATDRDSGMYGHVTYDLLSGDLSSLFSVDKTTGIVGDLTGYKVDLTLSFPAKIMEGQPGQHSPIQLGSGHFFQPSTNTCYLGNQGLDDEVNQVC